MLLLGILVPRMRLFGWLKIPAIYAMILAIIFVQVGIALPAPLQKAVTLSSAAAVPCMLILLGLELNNAAWSRNFKVLGIPMFLRLLAGPIIALGFSALFGLPKFARQAGITEAGMPSAVMTTILASEFNLDSALITSIVFITTLLSPVTLTILLVLLGA